jgi:hypothetical protein
MKVKMKRVTVLALLTVFLLVISAGAASALPAGKEGDPNDGVDLDAFLPAKSGDKRTYSGIYYGAYNHIEYWTWADKEDVTIWTLTDEGPKEKHDVRLYEDMNVGNKRPVLWRVVGEEEDAVVLMSEYVLDAHRFDFTGGTNSWEGSDIRRWLNEAYYDHAKGYHDMRAGRPFGSFLYERKGDPLEERNPFNPAELGNGKDGPILSTEVTTNGTPTTDRFYLLQGISGDSGRVSWRASGDLSSPDFFLDDISATVRMGTFEDVLEDIVSKTPDGNLPPDDEGVHISLKERNREILEEHPSVFDYWLRTPYQDDEVLIVNSDDKGEYQVTSSDIRGQVENYADNNDEPDGWTDIGEGNEGQRGVRPVFRLNPKSIIFASEISGDPKKGGMSVINNYYETSQTGRNYKLTILDKSLSLGQVTVKGDEQVELFSDGKVVSADISNDVSVTATGLDWNIRLAYKIVRSDDGKREIAAYGLGDLAGGYYRASEAVIKTSDLEVSGDYTVYVWAQNDDSHHAHAGSKPRYFKLAVLPGGSSGGSGSGGGGSSTDGGGGSSTDGGGGSGAGSGGGGGCSAGLGIPIFLTALTMCFAVKRRKP